MILSAPDLTLGLVLLRKRAHTVPDARAVDLLFSPLDTLLFPTWLETRLQGLEQLKS